LARRDTRDNIILQPGDSIHIPEFVPSVRVTGAVNAPGSVLWKPGEGLGYYVSAAGGYTREADEGRTSVRYANGEVQTKSKSLIFFSNSPTPNPGADVFVPAQILGITAALASVLASTVAVIVALQP
jgi:protein involved in polysaccharide export with SLBB domain